MGASRRWSRLLLPCPERNLRRAPGVPVPEVQSRATEVVFVLLPGVVLLDVAGPADAFRNAASRIPGSYRLRFVAPRKAITAAVGLNLSGLEPLPDRLAPGTILVL